MATVASRNPFDLLGDEDVEIKVVEQPKEATITTTTPRNETAPVQKRDKHRGRGGDTRGKSDHSQRGGFKNNNAPKGNDDRSGPRDLNVGPRLSGRHEDDNYNNNYPSRSSRGARPGERGRGRGNRRGGDVGGRGREFDRHSGTGKYDSGKKEKQGWGSSNVDWESKNKNNNDKSNEFSSSWETGNDGNAADSGSTWNATESQEPTNDWGTKDENGGDDNNWNTGNVESQSWEMKEEESTLETNGTDNTKGDIAGDDDATAKPVEPEEVVKTLDEYLSEKAQKVLDISLPEARKPNEGVDDTQWKDTVPLEKKKEEDVLFSGKEQSFKAKNKNKKSKNYLEIEQTFVKPGGFQRGGFQRGGRGGRGGGRGGGRNYDDHDNRDNNRRGGGERSYDNRDNRRRGGGGNRNNHVNIDDQRAFPSLGTV